MESIIDILHKGGYSCVMKNREEVRTFTQRGVADLYDLYQADLRGVNHFVCKACGS